MLEFITQSKLEAETLKEIESAYGAPLTTSMRNYLEDEELLQDCQLAKIVPTFVANKLRRIFPLPEAVSPPGLEMPQVRIASTILALQADKEPEIISFRNHVLREKKLNSNDIESWVNRTARRENSPSRWLIGIPIPDGHEIVPGKTGGVAVKPDIEMMEATRAGGYELRFENSDGEVKGIYVAVGGSLDKLRNIALSLTHAYGWNQEKAVTFVLCGIPPIVESIKVGSETYPNAPSHARVTLSIDPSMLPQEVAATYAWARDKWFDTGRRLSIKHQTLALFYAKHWKFTDAPRTSKRKLMEDWNELCRSDEEYDANWVYDKANATQQFMRDAKQAYTNIVRGRPSTRNYDQTNLRGNSDHTIAESGSDDSAIYLGEPDFYWYQKNILEKFPEVR